MNDECLGRQDCFLCGHIKIKLHVKSSQNQKTFEELAMKNYSHIEELFKVHVLKPSTDYIEIITLLIKMQQVVLAEPKMP